MNSRGLATLYNYCILSFCKYFTKHFQECCGKLIWLKGLSFVTQIFAGAKKKCKNANKFGYLLKYKKTKTNKEKKPQANKKTPTKPKQTQRNKKPLQTVDNKTHLPSSLWCVLLECSYHSHSLGDWYFERRFDHLKIMINIKMQYLKKYYNI